MATLSLADVILEENFSALHTLLQYGVDVNEIDAYGFTPLIEAAIVNNENIAQLLLSHGADVNGRDMTGGTALHWAAENNNLELAQLLLQHGADPNAHTFAGQPVLTMPVLRKQKAIKDLLIKAGADLSFTQDFINTKLLGHIYELVGTADVVDPKHNFAEVDFEGFFLEFSLGIVRDALDQFQNHFAARKLRRYNELSQIIVHALDNASRLIHYQQYQTKLDEHQAEINAWLRQEPLLIPVGYEGHAITFVKLGNILAKCDRREDSRLYDNIVFYHVNQPLHLTPEFIKNLIYNRNSDKFINEEMHYILDLQPITELKIEAQKSGNCSWANVEAAIPTIFFLLLLSSSDNHKDIAMQKSIALDYFKQWRDWNKERTLQFCIQSFKNRDTIRNACKAQILAAVLFQCCSIENAADRPRIEAILAVLTQPDYAYILENYIKTYLYESRSEEGIAFGNLLKAYGVM